MTRGWLAATVLLLMLSGLTWAGSLFVRTTLERWFERDLHLQSRLAVTSARQALVAAAERKDPATVTTLLEDIARDERIMSAALCRQDGTQIAATREYPQTFGCGLVTAHQPDAAWHTKLPTAGEPIEITLQPLGNGTVTLGTVVLVHDLSDFRRRQASIQVFLWIAFVVLALCVVIVTSVSSRLSWWKWTNELRRLIRGENNRPEFRRFVRDVRDLIDRLSNEHEIEGDGGHWNALRLKHTLIRHLHGERILILANREPYIHEQGGSGEVQVLHPASGLVTALEPVMRACSGVWIAHGSGSADRATVDPHDRIRIPPGEESYSLRRVWLTPEEEAGYYYGFSNEGLWPLCHIADARPTFRAADWEQYRKVNERFAAAVCEEADTDDPIVLVQDYHFALAPRMIRKRIPRATIITFWHIPWPNAERFSICPWRDEILDGLLGSSIVGFHIQLHCNNFLDAVDRTIEARIDREQNAVILRGDRTLVRPYPISIEWPTRRAGTAKEVAEERAAVRAELGLSPDALLGFGVDRLDYTKGIEERLLAVERLLEREPSLQGRFTFLQVAAPSRTAIERYRQATDSVERLAARINSRLGGSAYQPIILRRAHHEPEAVFRYYRAADLCYVSSLHDGMNLVAKEFVASRDDERGVLILSHFTGAARELQEALIVNPYDLEEASTALSAALTMSPDEQRERMRAMRTQLAEFNVYRWAGRMLLDAARLRRRERFTGRLGEQWPARRGRRGHIQRAG